jgi:anion-transporting  ArsA/GET3 family ATPase
MRISKRLFLQFSIVLTLISIIWSVLDYIGVIRLFKLKSKRSTNKLIQNYSKLEKLGKTKKTTLSFVMSDSSEQRPFINSILDQTSRFDDIIAINNETDKKTDYVSDIAVIIPKISDINETTKIYQALLREEQDTLIISVNSDKIYGKDYMFALYELHEQFPDTLLYNDSFILATPSMFENCLIDINSNKSLTLKILLSKVKKYKKIEKVKSDINFCL